MNTCVDVTRAKAMRLQGKTLQEIGDEFGVTRERIRQLVGPLVPAGHCADCGASLSRAKAIRCETCSRREANRPKNECLGCGRVCRGERCWECRRRLWKAERERKYDQLEEMWKAGLSVADMAERFETTPNALGGTIHRARAAGWDLPRRRPHSPKAKNLSKAESRFQFMAAILNGKIRRPTRCENCGGVGPVDGHHHDYNRPLYVTWLCPPCHHQQHAAEQGAIAA